MAANNQLTTKVVSDFQELYQNIDDIENTEFTFDNEGRLLLKKKKMDYFVAEVNKAVREGKVQVKDARLLSCNEWATGRCTMYTTTNNNYQNNPG